MDKKRFIKTYSQGTLTTNEIWVDKETGVNYFFHAAGYAGGLTPLLDRDGKPVITRVERDYDYKYQVATMQLSFIFRQTKKSAFADFKMYV